MTNSSAFIIAQSVCLLEKNWFFCLLEVSFFLSFFPLLRLLPSLSVDGECVPILLLLLSCASNSNNNITIIINHVHQSAGHSQPSHLKLVGDRICLIIIYMNWYVGTSVRLWPARKWWAKKWFRIECFISFTVEDSLRRLCANVKSTWWIFAYRIFPLGFFLIVFDLFMPSFFGCNLTCHRIFSALSAAANVIISMEIYV